MEANQNERALHFAYAKLISEMGKATGEELAYHLERSFTAGDSNYDAQIRYGRQLFLNDDLIASKKSFDQLKNIRAPAEVRNRLLYPLPDLFQGKIVKIESSYVFIARDGLADWIYCHISDVDDTAWNQLTFGTRVSFKISFGIRGANAHSVAIIGRQIETKESQIKLFKTPSA